MNSESTGISGPPRTTGTATSGCGAICAESHPAASSAAASTPNAERSTLPGLVGMDEPDHFLVMINRDPADAEQ